jgi:hypothetical protein
MTTSVSRARGGSSSALLKAVLSLYVLAAALMPLGHHDVACHLKSSTHCTTCVVGASGDVAAHATTMVRSGLPEAGEAEIADVAFLSEGLTSPSPGRAPPAA